MSKGHAESIYYELQLRDHNKPLNDRPKRRKRIQTSGSSERVRWKREQYPIWISYPAWLVFKREFKQPAIARLVDTSNEPLGK